MFSKTYVGQAKAKRDRRMDRQTDGQKVIPMLTDGQKVIPMLCFASLAPQKVSMSQATLKFT